MTKLEELEAENTLMNKQLEQIEELGNENLNALLDRIKAHRSAPDVYDPPTFDQMADRIEELEAQLMVAGKALNRLLRPPNGHPRIEAATKEEWAVRAMNAEDKLAKVIEDLEQKLCDYCDEADPMRQAMCLAKECGVAVTEMTPKLSK